jgi:hypothetical protein
VSQPIERNTPARDSAQTRRHTPDPPRTAGSAQKRFQENATRTETQHCFSNPARTFFFFEFLLQCKRHSQAAQDYQTSSPKVTKMGDAHPTGFAQKKGGG